MSLSVKLLGKDFMQEQGKKVTAIVRNALASQCQTHRMLHLRIP